MLFPPYSDDVSVFVNHPHATAVLRNDTTVRFARLREGCSARVGVDVCIVGCACVQRCCAFVAVVPRVQAALIQGVSAGTEDMANIQSQLHNKGLEWKRTTEVRERIVMVCHCKRTGPPCMHVCPLLLHCHPHPPTCRCYADCDTGRP